MLTRTLYNSWILQIASNVVCIAFFLNQKFLSEHGLYERDGLLSGILIFLFCFSSIVTILLANKTAYSIDTGRGFLKFGFIYILLSAIPVQFIDVLGVDSAILKRALYFVYASPIFFVSTLVLIRASMKKLLDSKVCFIVVVSLIGMFVPGFYAPPFFNGFAGWVVKIDLRAPIRLAGFKFVNSQGQEEWMTNSVITPSNFMFRHWHWLKLQPHETIQVGLDFFINAHSRYYFDAYSKGVSPNGILLGSFAYPGHDNYVTPDYSNFHPDNLRRLIFVHEFYDRTTLKLIQKDVEMIYDIKNKKVLKNEYIW